MNIGGNEALLEDKSYPGSNSLDSMEIPTRTNHCKCGPVSKSELRCLSIEMIMKNHEIRLPTCFDREHVARIMTIASVLLCPALPCTPRNTYNVAD